MNRVTSSSNPQKKKFPVKNEKNLKRERIPVNLLKGFGTRISGGSSSCSNVTDSVSISGEGLNVCHRFLLSHSFSSSSSSLGDFRPVKSVTNKTPKSAPVVSKPLIRKEETKLKSNVTEKPKLKRCNTNSISMKPDKASVLKKKTSVSREFKLIEHQAMSRVDESIAQITPVSKLGTGSDLIYRSETTDRTPVTPPVQASVSPEIQFGSSMKLSASAQSQACYSAGHLLSGVSDKRKCKPKGILTVGKAKILYDFDEFEERESVMPLPVDASEHWLSSPCDEEKEHEKENDGFSQCVSYETLSPLSDRSTSSDLCNISSGRSLSPAKRRTSSSLSPNELSRFRRFMDLSSCEGVASTLDITPACELDPSRDKPSPLSVDTLGSENVIQTPESNSSFNKYFGHDLSSDLESLTMTYLSPRSQTSLQEPSSSSFNFDSIATSSASVDLSQFQRGNSHMPEMKLQQITYTESDMPNHKESAAPFSAAESISTDGGGLICSEDSNWMACYKNNFID